MSSSNEETISLEENSTPVASSSSEEVSTTTTSPSTTTTTTTTAAISPSTTTQNKIIPSNGTRRSAAHEEKEFMYPDDIPEEEAPTDIPSMLSLFCGVMGLMLKMKYISWLGALFCVSGLCNLKYSEMDFKQTVTTIMFSVMGLLMNYFGPAAQQQ